MNLVNNWNVLSVHVQEQISHLTFSIIPIRVKYILYSSILYCLITVITVMKPPCVYYFSIVLTEMCHRTYSGPITSLTFMGKFTFLASLYILNRIEKCLNAIKLLFNYYLLFRTKFHIHKCKFTNKKLTVPLLTEVRVCIVLETIWISLKINKTSNKDFKSLSAYLLDFFYLIFFIPKFILIYFFFMLF